MSGHNKWSKIKFTKAAADAKKGKIFARFSKEITLAAKSGGGDVDTNPRLRAAIEGAKAASMPKDNIDRAVKKGTGELQGETIQEVTYEGYGPGGVAVIVETTTDNRNRTAGEVRHYFDKFKGNLGATGCVSYLFSAKGVIVILKETVADEDALMEAALEAGAADFASEDDVFEIYTEPEDLYAVEDALIAAGYTITSAEKDKIPSNYVTLETEDDIKYMGLLLDNLDENEDVVNVYHNWENQPED